MEAVNAIGPSEPADTSEAQCKEICRDLGHDRERAIRSAAPTVWVGIDPRVHRCRSSRADDAGCEVDCASCRLSGAGLANRRWRKNPVAGHYLRASPRKCMTQPTQPSPPLLAVPRKALWLWRAFSRLRRPTPIFISSFQETGAGERIRTPDPLIRSQVLYPTELPVRRVAGEIAAPPAFATPSSAVTRQHPEPALPTWQHDQEDCSRRVRPIKFQPSTMAPDKAPLRSSGQARRHPLLYRPERAERDAHGPLAQTGTSVADRDPPGVVVFAGCDAYLTRLTSCQNSLARVADKVQQTRYSCSHRARIAMPAVHLRRRRYRNRPRRVALLD